MGKNCFCGHGHRVEVRNSALSGAAHKGRAAGCVCKTFLFNICFSNGTGEGLLTSASEGTRNWRDQLIEQRQGGGPKKPGQAGGVSGPKPPKIQQGKTLTLAHVEEEALRKTQHEEQQERVRVLWLAPN